MGSKFSCFIFSKPFLPARGFFCCSIHWCEKKFLDCCLSLSNCVYAFLILFYEQLMLILAHQPVSRPYIIDFEKIFQVKLFRVSKIFLILFLAIRFIIKIFRIQAHIQIRIIMLEPGTFTTAGSVQSV